MAQTDRREYAIIIRIDETWAMAVERCNEGVVDYRNVLVFYRI